MSRRTDHFHQARWNEPVIFQLDSPGEVGIGVPCAEAKVEALVRDGVSGLPDCIRRQSAPALPRLGQMQVLKHFLRLSQETLGADLNIDVGQGTCTMKYSPKVHEAVVRSHKLAEVHPLQDAETIQGTLEIIHETARFLGEISGMEHFTFHPRSGSQAILTMASMVRAYHESSGEGEQRNEVITTEFSHPSDAAAAHVLGYKIVRLQYDPQTGLPDVEHLRNIVSKRTAAMFITNPEDTGLFNPRIREFTEIVHGVGGLCCYDQANANGILGITRACEAGFDTCFFNLHKTFSVPHGCGGPGVGAVGVRDVLEPYLPCPVVEKRDDIYSLNFDRPQSIGHISSFMGVIPGVVRAYAWIRSLGAQGLKQVAQIAVLNNNYLLHHIRQIRGASAPYSEGGRRIEQVRYSWQQLFEETGVTTADVTNRMCDYGMHMWSSHHPFVVDNPMTLEPTESYSQAELDEYLDALRSISKEAYESPDVVKSAPHRSCIHKVPHDSFDDPDKWAITWRAYCRKHGTDQAELPKPERAIEETLVT